MTSVAQGPIDSVVGEPVSAVELGPVTVYLGAKSGKYPDGNLVMIRGADTTVVCDTPLVALRVPEVIRSADLCVLGHAHEDHLVGMHLLPGVPVQAPQADLAAVQSEAGLAAHYGYRPETLAVVLPQMIRDFHYQPRPDATGYDDGTQWDLGGGVRLRAFHLPGHTSGHTALVVEPEGIAFIGDIDLTGFGPYYGDATSNLSLFRKSLEAVKDLPARCWVTSHHKAVVRDRETFLSLLAAFRQKLDDREDAIAQTIGSEPVSFGTIAARRFVYPQDYPSPFVNDVEHHCLRQHLAEMVAKGRIQTVDGLYRRAG